MRWTPIAVARDRPCQVLIQRLLAESSRGPETPWAFTLSATYRMPGGTEKGGSRSPLGERRLRAPRADQCRVTARLARGIGLFCLQPQSTKTIRPMSGRAHSLFRTCRCRSSIRWHHYQASGPGRLPGDLWRVEFEL
jgi:hypothetical protein